MRAAMHARGLRRSMNEPLLMVSTASQWLGPARMARALAKAGCEVTLLAPAGSLAAKSRYIAKRHVLAGNAIPMEWLQSLIAAVDDTAPRLLVPCDEMAVRLLFALVLEPPPDLPSATRLALEALIRTSLGDPAFYQTSIDKILLPPAAEALGIRLPAYALVDGLDEAIGCAATLGYPLVLKRRFGFAGEGVAIVTDADDLIDQGQSLYVPTSSISASGGRRNCWCSLSSAARITPRRSRPGREKHWPDLPGNGKWRRCRAKDRRRCCASCAPRKAKPTPTRCARHSASAAFATSSSCSTRMAARIFSRSTAGSSRTCTWASASAPTWRRDGKKLRGLPTGPRVDPPAEAGPSVAIFPREWLRDPRSTWLRECPADVPWDEPALLKAMLAMRH